PSASTALQTACAKRSAPRPRASGSAATGDRPEPAPQAVRRKTNPPTDHPARACQITPCLPTPRNHDRSSSSREFFSSLLELAPTKLRTSSPVLEVGIEHGIPGAHGRRRAAQRHLPILHDVSLGFSSRHPEGTREAERA